MATKTCPDCTNVVDIDLDECGCGYSWVQIECPGCDSRIDMFADICPVCNFNLNDSITAKKPKAPKVPKAGKTAQKKKAAFIPSGGRYLIHVPALGRHGKKAIDFPELHLKISSPTDEELITWAEMLRAAYLEHDTLGKLSNHGVYYLAQTGDPVLRKNADRILQLIGGDDWK